jgi:hypothetical protein
MNPAARTAAIGVLYLLGCVVAALAVAALVVNSRPGAASLIILTVAYLPYATVGSILVARRPGNAIGWVLLAIGWAFATSFLPIRATAYELQTLSALPLAETVAWFNGWSISLVFALFATLAFVFPSGRLPNGRSGRVVAVVLVVTWVIVVVSALRPVMTVFPDGATNVVEIPNPFGRLPLSILGLLGIPADALSPVPPDVYIQPAEITVRSPDILSVILLLAVASIIGRYVRARDLERLQLRWLVAALASITVAIPAGFAIGAVVGLDSPITWVPAAVGFTLPPIAIGIAVLRYRLYEIDRIISRTIGWAAITSILATTFATLVVGLQAALGGITQSRTPVVAVSTLVAFAVFQPVRRRVQAAVDHRFNRARYDADRLATAFADRLRDEVDLTAVSGDIAGVVDAALRPSAIAVWIRRSRPIAP